MQALNIAVRTRTNAEVVSLGFLLAKRHFFRLWLLSLPMWALALVIALLVGAVLDNWSLGILVLWYLRPLVERAPLLALSRLVFSGMSPQLSAADWRVVCLGGWGELLPWRRFAVAGRVCRFAVSALEGLRGLPARQRVRFLARGGGVDIGVQLGLALIEMALLVSVLLFTSWFLPPERFSTLKSRLRLLLNPDFYLPLLFFSALAAMVVSVFFLSIGFTAYLNKRLVDEGWAVALSMRKLAEKVQRLLLGVVMALALGGAVFTPAPSVAATMSTAQAQQVMQDVLHEKAVSPLGVERDVGQKRQWRLLLGDRMRLVIVLALVSLLLVLLFMLRRGQQARLPVSAAAQDKSLPLVSEDSAAALGLVRSLLAKGETTAALGALFRAALARVRVQVLPSDCERVCVEKVRSKDAAVAEFFSTLTRTWQQAAFAGQVVSVAEVEGLLAQFARVWR